MEKDGREYALLDPTVNLGAVLTIQNMEAHKQGKKTSDRIMCGVFVEQEASGYQNQPNPTYQPAQPRQPQQPSNPPPSTEFDDLDIPF